MHFRVTSVAGSIDGKRLSHVTVVFEDALNSSIQHIDFGSAIDQFTIVVVSVHDEPEENELFAKGHRRLATARDQFTGEAVRYLSVAVPVPPSALSAVTDAQLPAFVAFQIRGALEIKPSRVPKGLNFEGLARSVVATVSACTESAV